MTDKKVSNQVINVNQVVAAVAGVVVGGAAVAGAMFMSDKNNQDKVKEVVSDVKANLEDKKDLALDKAKKLENIVKNTVSDVKNI